MFSPRGTTSAILPSAPIPNAPQLIRLTSDNSTPVTPQPASEQSTIGETTAGARFFSRPVNGQSSFNFVNGANDKWFAIFGNKKLLGFGWWEERGGRWAGLNWGIWRDNNRLRNIWVIYLVWVEFEGWGRYWVKYNEDSEKSGFYCTGAKFLITWGFSCQVTV